MDKLKELLHIFEQLSDDHKQAVIVRARTLLVNQEIDQNKNAAQLHGRQESDPKIRTSKKDSTP